MTRIEFAKMLKDIAYAIELGDCLGGSITFNSFYLKDSNNIEVLCVLRTGNLQGQGGIVCDAVFEPSGILKNFMQITDPNDDSQWFKLMPKI